MESTQAFQQASCDTQKYEQAADYLRKADVLYKKLKRNSSQPDSSDSSDSQSSEENAALITTEQLNIPEIVSQENAEVNPLAPTPDTLYEQLMQTQRTPLEPHVAAEIAKRDYYEHKTEQIKLKMILIEKQIANEEKRKELLTCQIEQMKKVNNN